MSVGLAELCLHVLSCSVERTLGSCAHALLLLRPCFNILSVKSNSPAIVGGWRLILLADGPNWTRPILSDEESADPVFSPVILAEIMSVPESSRAPLLAMSLEALHAYVVWTNRTLARIRGALSDHGIVSGRAKSKDALLSLVLPGMDENLKFGLASLRFVRKKGLSPWATAMRKWHGKLNSSNALVTVLRPLAVFFQSKDKNISEVLSLDSNESVIGGFMADETVPLFDRHRALRCILSGPTEDLPSLAVEWESWPSEQFAEDIRKGSAGELKASLAPYHTFSDVRIQHAFPLLPESILRLGIRPVDATGDDPLLSNREILRAAALPDVVAGLLADLAAALRAAKVASCPRAGSRKRKRDDENSTQPTYLPPAKLARFHEERQPVDMSLDEFIDVSVIPVTVPDANIQFGLPTPMPLGGLPLPPFAFLAPIANVHLTQPGVIYRVSVWDLWSLATLCSARGDLKLSVFPRRMSAEWRAMDTARRNGLQYFNPAHLPPSLPSPVVPPLAELRAVFRFQRQLIADELAVGAFHLHVPYPVDPDPDHAAWILGSMAYDSREGWDHITLLRAWWAVYGAPVAGGSSPPQCPVCHITPCQSLRVRVGPGFACSPNLARDLSGRPHLPYNGGPRLRRAADRMRFGVYRAAGVPLGGRRRHFPSCFETAVDIAYPGPLLVLPKGFSV